MTMKNKTDITSTMTPIDSKNRLHHIDSLRGLALLGILLVNMFAFQYGLIGYTYILPELNTVDRTTYLVIEWLLQGSFYPIFAILFGFGAAIMWERAEEKGRPFKRVFARRLILLILLGWLHLHFIWAGDILLTYGGTALLLFFFYNRKKKTLLVWIIALTIFISLTGFMSDGEGDKYFTFKPFADYEAEVLAEGSYSDIVEHRFTNSPFEKMKMPPGIDPLKQEFIIGFTAFFSYAIMVIQTFILFLIGLLITKSRWLHELDRNQHSFKKVATIAITAGLIVKAGNVFTNSGILEYFGYFIGGPIAAIGYIALFALLYSKLQQYLLFNGFGYVGRMALTNYLMQSVVMTTIFYGYGLGLFGQLGTLIAILLAMVLFVLQIIFSRFWLERYKFGPVEWLWRTGTYWKKQSIKK
ncbi:DUF418 domain-containing protein [Bacillus shivajii]|uniref:DUF418 domain-containing protein n=1 Tax=Bacillus shivajii TaxID=1983719 RepID=UPI001CFBA11E|nr:DUF418 domain-containing protein [Bacillus shivajii]UCZ53822.1 DUF418 domain-containing protein [Bacillus shivajii]